MTPGDVPGLGSKLMEALGGTLQVQRFRPLCESLEWELGKLAWLRQGSLPFRNRSVPYKITSDGNLSRKAAEICFSSLAAADETPARTSRILVLEHGVGLGLFARYFLDSFQELCHEQGKDYYGRLLYILADASPAILDDIRRHDVLCEHREHVATVRADASEPSLGLADFLREHAAGKNGALHAIIFNYLLDSLPFSFLRIDGDAVEELCARTLLARGIDLAQFTRLEPAEIAALAESSNAAGKAELLGLMDALLLETSYRPADPAKIPYFETLLHCRGAQNLVQHNHGALRCLQDAVRLLAPGGFVQVSDYRSPPVEEAASRFRYQRFGSTTALGLNFPLIQACATKLGLGQWVEPDGDNAHLCSRLLAQSPDIRTVELFRERFGAAAFDRHFKPIEEARKFIRDQRWESALRSFRKALAVQPRNWALLGEIAEFMTFKLGDHDRAARLTREAVEINPLSPDLWNIHGDCLYLQGQQEAAHYAYSRALQVNPEDVRARYNLSFVSLDRRQFGDALKWIAEALALDRKGDYRDRLLNKQQEVLRAISRQNEARSRRLSDRFHSS